MELPPEAIEQLLDGWPVARLATQGEVGPHLVPVVFVRAMGRIWSPVDGKPKRGRELARVRNVRERPDVSLLLDHYDADWARLWWLRVDGAARVVPAGAGEAGGEAQAAVAALRAKYPQYGEIPVLDAAAILIAIEPLRIASWCGGPSAVPALS